MNKDLENTKILSQLPIALQRGTPKSVVRNSYYFICPWFCAYAVWGRASRELLISAPRGVSQAHLRLHGPQWLTDVVLAAGCRASRFLLQTCFPCQQGSLDFLLHTWLRNCPFLWSVIHSITSVTFCHTRSANTSRGKRHHLFDSWNGMCIWRWENYRWSSLQIIYHKPHFQW